MASRTSSSCRYVTSWRNHGPRTGQMKEKEKRRKKEEDIFDQTSNRVLQRNLNNAFAYDLVPSPTVVTAALKAARRVNDFPTAVRIFEGKQFTESCSAVR